MLAEVAGGVPLLLDAGEEDDLEHLPGHQAHPAAHRRAALGTNQRLGEGWDAILAHQVALRVGAIHILTLFGQAYFDVSGIRKGGGAHCAPT